MEPSEQRWAAAPSEPLPFRRKLAKWAVDVRGTRNSDRHRVVDFVERQLPYNPDLKRWIDERAGLYASEFPNEPEMRHRGEAMLDLICWQRRNHEPQAVLKWLKEHTDATE